MALKSSNPDRHPCANPKLGPAIAHFAEDPSREHRAQLLESLMAGPLLIAIQELPEAFDPKQGDEAPVRFVTAEGPKGARVVCGFSSTRSLAAKVPAAVAFAVDPASLLNWIVEADMEGLQLDPQGPSAFISNAEAREALGLPPAPGSSGRSISLGQGAENAVREALEQLLERTGPEGHATVREARTGKSVLFARAEGDALMMVLRAGELAQDERERAQMLFDELAGDAADLPEAEGAAPDREQWADFQALFSGDVGQAAKTAVKVFTWVFGFLPGFELQIDQH